MNFAEIKHWDDAARKNFAYLADGPKDLWRSHADDVLANKSWQDDCDGLAMTVLDLCVRAGLPMEDAFRLAVYASSDGSGHMAGGIYDDELSIWVVGDTFKAAYPAAWMLHKPNVYNRLSERRIDPITGKDISQWRGGAPWIVKGASAK